MYLPPLPPFSSTHSFSFACQNSLLCFIWMINVWVYFPLFYVSSFGTGSSDGATKYLQYRVQSSVWRLPNYWPPTPSPPSECVLPPHQRRCVHHGASTHSPGGEGVGGGPIFRKTLDIGLASYSIVPLRIVVLWEFYCTICCLVCPTGDQHSLINNRSTTKMGSTGRHDRKINK